MTREQVIVAIVVALIGAIGAALGGGFAFAQFLIKRKDEKEANNVQHLIDEAVEKAKREMHEEFMKGLQEREQTGLQRFNINSEQITKNTEQIAEILDILKGTAEKYDTMVDTLSSLNKVSKACAEGVRSTLYDKICVVAKKALRRKAITVSEKTNIHQLYMSYTELQGENDKAETYHNECMRLDIVEDEDAIKMDLALNGAQR